MLVGIGLLLCSNRKSDSTLSAALCHITFCAKECDFSADLSVDTKINGDVRLLKRNRSSTFIKLKFKLDVNR